MPIKFDLSKYKKNIFIETGTYMGEGVDYALVQGFEKVYSIELDKERYLECKEKFKENSNVFIYEGDSSVVLKEILKSIDESCVIFLDAHYCADGSSISEKMVPVKRRIGSYKKS